jgi:glycosyltransferase involved in cell wall biosynthesis
MRSVLMIAWLFPPHASVGSRRSYRLARELAALGWHVTVLTQACVPERLREQGDHPLPERVRVLRAYDPPLMARLVARLDARASHRIAAPHGKAHTLVSGKGGSSLSFAERWIPTEPAAIWVPHATVRALLERERYDVVWSTSYPFSAHSAGRAIAYRLRIPWVADLRDPWTLHFSHAKKHPIVQSIERALERATFREASAITVTTEALRDAYRQRFRSRSADIHTVYNSFDPIALPAPSRDVGPARLVHFGHVYGGARTLGPVIEALASIAKRRALTAHDVVLENFGRFSDEDLALARSLGVESLLRLREPVAYKEGMASLTRASLLLLPVWKSEYGPLFLPAKLFDYLHVGAPILAIGDNPELASILARTRAGTLLAEQERPAIERVIEAALHGTCSIERDVSQIEAFSSRSMAKAMSAVLDEVIARATITRRRA